MSSSKANNAIRLPENEDQARLLRNITLDNKATKGTTSKDKATDTSSWGTDQLLGTSIDEDGHPVPDPMSDNGGKAMNQEQDGDVYEAMTEDFD